MRRRSALPVGRRFGAGALYAGLLLGSGAARAEPPSDGEQPVETPPPADTQPGGQASPCATSAHDAEVARASELYEARDDRAAIEAWQSVLGALGEPCGWKLHFNLALAHERSGDVNAAVEHFDAFLRLGTTHADDSSVAARLAQAAGRSQRLKRGHGLLQVPSANRWVQIDSGEPRRAGFSVYLGPGEHAITIDPGTPRARVRRVTTRPGETTVLEWNEPSPPPPPEPSAGFPTPWVIAGSVLTVASIALPVGLYFYTQGKRSDAQAVEGTDAYPDALDDFRSARVGYHVSYALPAAFALATAVVIIVHAAGSDDGETALMLSPGPLCSPHAGATIALLGSF